MNFEKKVPLAGSKKVKPAGKSTEISDRNELIEVTIRLRRKKEISEALQSQTRLTHEEYQEQYGASETDVASVLEFAAAHHLDLKERNMSSRTLKLSGKILDFEHAFSVKLAHYESSPGKTVRGRSGEIHIPEQFAGIIKGIFGLDNRPVARPMFQVKKNAGKFVSHAASPASFTADKLAKIYGFPTGNGQGQTIGIIELGGGFTTDDIGTYFKQLNLNVPKVSSVLVDGASNSPDGADGADGEVMLDIEVAGAVAPSANIVVYFAPNTDQGFLDAITQAIHDTDNKPSVLSISWGSAEASWTDQSMTNFDDAFQSAATLGISICIASGDSGSRDGETDGKVHVDFPASSPYALACGGTTLKISGSTIASEVVWNDSDDSASGGGVSEFFPLPDYQSQAKVPVSVSTKFKGRGLPDVAANADPDTGYNVLVDGQQLVIGGTSAVAPLMAGLIAILNQQSSKPVGFVNPVLYSNPGLCRDITSGNNKTTSAKTGYTAAKGWDACTGWGVLSHLDTQVINA